MRTYPGKHPYLTQGLLPRCAHAVRRPGCIPPEIVGISRTLLLGLFLLGLAWLETGSRAAQAQTSSPSPLPSAIPQTSTSAARPSAPPQAPPAAPPSAPPVKPWFDHHKTPNLILVLSIAGCLLFYIREARSGKPLYIRRLAGLSALDEAVGRATEMGKPVLYVTGMTDIDDIQTLSSLSILSHVARRTAEYEAELLVPCRWSVTMSTAQEVVHEAYIKAGRADAYQPDKVRYITEDQFGFVAGVDGIMLRERPAANFYLGQFFAESLILAETGHGTGAIQIGGTAAPSQLPFFVAACDYTLMGEELYAASAYLSRDPLQVGSLKGQDAAKALCMLLIVVLCLLRFVDPEITRWLRP